MGMGLLLAAALGVVGVAGVVQGGISSGGGMLTGSSSAGGVAMASRLSSVSIEASEMLSMRAGRPFELLLLLLLVALDWEVERRGGRRFFGRTEIRCRAAVWFRLPVGSSAASSEDRVVKSLGF